MDCRIKSRNDEEERDRFSAATLRIFEWDFVLWPSCADARPPAAIFTLTPVLLACAGGLS